ncbi:type VI secretion system baseplate subunit TssE [Blastopirellula marina]|uniref:Type VI secretion system baseplate subunit TssE n=1 Tax=Blastopirellula marina TaxID=124 RepID=A0A2S8G6Z5_9BACT|nr:type VI secretion system baseplate subunit TssE [Blastopirellula marina]PQO40021.1 type VI secretion system baseplate subunit TssE [Blastopirellula marina]PQO43684.1 type VI secretion system baseplate subunit TssE [Blastopirellula marina]PTL45396.1 type VI secretion system baseplate subunit TssE [Blastopirellula marina]
MPRPSPTPDLTPSIYDRLVDACFEVEPDSRAQSVRGFVLGICRDLEDLLNTSASRPSDEVDVPAVRESVYCYGVPELTLHDGATQADMQALAADIETTIRRFEPRLDTVRVNIDVSQKSVWNRISFAIEGTSKSLPNSRIRVEAAFNPTNRRIEVTPNDSTT